MRRRGPRRGLRGDRRGQPGTRVERWYLLDEGRRRLSHRPHGAQPPGERAQTGKEILGRPRADCSAEFVVDDPSSGG